MELRKYASVLRKWWWVVVTGTLVVTIASLIFVSVRPPKYEATATMLVSPATSLDNISEVRASLDVLDQPVVANTYAEIAQSDTVRAAAWEELGVATPTAERWEYDVRSSVRQQTNIVEIKTEGPDPIRAMEVANAVAHQTITFVDGLYDVYDLRFLDPAGVSHSPVGLDNRLAILIGIILGLGLGVTAAFLGEYLQVPAEPSGELPSGTPG